MTVAVPSDKPATTKGALSSSKTETGNSMYSLALSLFIVAVLRVLVGVVADFLLNLWLFRDSASARADVQVMPLGVTVAIENFPRKVFRHFLFIIFMGGGGGGPEAMKNRNALVLDFFGVLEIIVSPPSWEGPPL